MRKALFLGFIFVLMACYSYAKEYSVNSPDGKILLVVNVDSDIRWSASLDTKEIISSTRIAMVLADGRVLGENEKVRRVKESQLNETIS